MTQSQTIQTIQRVKLKKVITLCMNALAWHRYKYLISSLFNLSKLILKKFKTGEMEVKNPLFKEDFSSPSVASMPPAYSTLTPAQSESANSQETTSKQTQESQQQQPTKPTDSNEQPSTSNINEVADFLSASGNKN